MCGIVGYIGHKEAASLLFKGLQRLEYRGYDSAGIALLNHGDLAIHKCSGKVSDLIAHTEDSDLCGSIGMGHTRWATHGLPNDVNAHPHFSSNRELAIIHNGIIENYSSLRKELEHRGHDFKSETDTEVLINLIEDIRTTEKVDLIEAVRLALNSVVGAYAIVILAKDHPDEIIVAKKSSPLVIGVGKDELFVASDATPIVEYTQNVVYLKDEEIALLKRDGQFRIINIKNQEVAPYVQKLKMQLAELEKGGYEHFMLKEIYEQPKSIGDSMRGRVRLKQNKVQLGGIRDFVQRIAQSKRIIIVGCGTSWHAGLVGEYLFEDLCRIPVEVEYASEFRYRNPVISRDDVVIAISQSGETADTLAAIELAKNNNAIILGICNVVGSSIARITDAGSYTHAGPEIGVASTKAFTAQVTVLTLMALTVAQARGSLTNSDLNKLLYALNRIPEKIKAVLDQNDHIMHIAKQFRNSHNCLYLGRGYSFPVALEGALKLKEISYIHAEGYPAAEMKHGPIALIDEEMPVVVIATRGPNYEKVVSNIQEVKARKGVILAIVSEGDQTVSKMSDYVIEVPHVEEILMPLVSVIPLQLLSYHIAVMRGCNVDQPRNLAKSVTVE